MPDHDWQVFGTTLSTDFDLEGTTNYGNRDGWLFKTDSSGEVKLCKKIGGNEADWIQSAQHLGSDGFLTIGSTSSSDNLFSGYHGNGDVWVMKLDSNTNLESNFTYGGSNTETNFMRMRFNAQENHFSVSSWSFSNDGDVGFNYGYSDFWQLSIDSNGILLNSVVAGGSDYDYVYCNTRGDNLVALLGGLTVSDDFDVQDYKGNGDGWLVGISNYNSVQIIHAQNRLIAIFPNPSSDQLTVCLSTLIRTDARFELFSFDGRIVLTKSIFECTAIDIGHLSSGIYAYIVRDNSRIIYTGKLIIQ